MVNVTFTQNFDGYDDYIIQQLINGSQGRPYVTNDGLVIGEINSAERIEGTNTIRFHVGIFALV